MPRLRQLRYFVAVAEEGQMTAAAQKLHLPQPALSQAIARLEGQLGVDPLRRNHLGVTLTPRWFRRSRSTPSCLSSRAIACDSTGCARCSF